MQHPNQQGPGTFNLILAVVLATGIMLGWQMYFKKPVQQVAPQTTDAAVKKPALRKEKAASEKAEKPSPRVRISSPKLHGSIALRGARFDDLTLATYRETMAKDAPDVRLLTAEKANAYFAEFGLLASDESVAMPGPKTLWQADSEELTPQKPLTLSWENQQGLRFEKHIALDENYMFTITLKVINSGNNSAEVFPYGLIQRTTDDSAKHFYILHEGPLGVVGGELKEHSYKALREEGDVATQGKHGWLGITDKYWLTALVPVAGNVDAGFRHVMRESRDAYQVDMRGDAVEVPAGESAKMSVRFYAGAKEVKLLDQYRYVLDIPLFDRAVDFGSLYFLTKPIFHVLSWFHGIVGNFGIAILLLTVCIKLLMYPLANKSYTSMSRMKLLMPKMKELQERYKDDRMKLNTEMMELYKREKVNPAAGCLPMLVQIPVFFALYKVLFVTIEMRQAPFYGWIHDLSVPDPTNIFTLFGLLPFEAPSFLHIGVLPILMCITMVLQQRLNPKPTDPVQAAVIQWMPYIFLFLFSGFPAGLVLYWVCNNTLSIVQQSIIMRRLEKKGLKVR